MIEMLSRLRQAIEVPQLEYPRMILGFGPDFGLEGLLKPADLAPFRSIGLGSSLGPSVIPPVLDDGETAERAVYVNRDQDGPNVVLFTEEATRLWKVVREHLRRSPIWKELDQWKQILLEMLQARARLNRVIQLTVEHNLGPKVRWAAGPKEPHLSPALVPWVGWIATKKAGGSPVSDPTGQVKVENPGRIVGPAGTIFAVGVEDADIRLERLLSIIPVLVSSNQVKAMIRAESRLLDKASRVRQILEELLLIHYVPGNCSICRKLGGG
jgi:hypothetical protein